MEKWRELLSPLDRELAHAVSVDKVFVSRDGKRMNILFQSTKFLEGKAHEELTNAIQAGFPGVRVETVVRYAALRDGFLQNPNTYAELLSSRVAERYPGALPYLVGTENPYLLQEKTLHLQVRGKIAADSLRQRGVDIGLSAILGELFGLKLPVVIRELDSEEAALQMAEKRREEDRAIAQQLTKMIEKAEAKESKAKPLPSGVLFGKAITRPVIEMCEITERSRDIAVTGKIFTFNKDEKKTLIINPTFRIMRFAITDYTNSISCKIILKDKRTGEPSPEYVELCSALDGALSDGKWVTVQGIYSFDSYERDVVLHVNDIAAASAPKREDTAAKKRVELHVHTQMSAMDALASASDLIKQCAKWGHKAVAITDHGVVQAFPEAFAAAKKNGIKLIPGCEGYLIGDSANVVSSPNTQKLSECTFVVVDVETTGLSTRTDEIIELGAVRFENGVEVAEFNTLINPGRSIPPKVVELTGINDAMVRDKPRIGDVIGKFAEFAKGAVLCAHNAPFDMAFIGRAYAQAGIPFSCPQLDTLPLFRNVYKELKSHKLMAVCKHLRVKLNDAHRASNDARATGLCMFKALKDPACAEASTVSDLNKIFRNDVKEPYNHIILLATCQKGLRNLNILVSESHIHYFNAKPKMPRSLISKYREGLLLGSACEAGELYRAILRGENDATLRKIASFYDYLEIQPLGNNEFMLRNKTVETLTDLENINRKIVQIGKELGKPVVAAGDVHFMEEKDAIYRAIIMSTQGYEDADQQAPLYLRTTDEMLAEFAYLGKEEAYRVVVEAPNEIADRIGEISLFPKHPEGKETFQPFLAEAEDDILTRVRDKSTELYGSPVPELIQKRIDKELHSIIGFGFATLYDIAIKLVAESNRNGYLVGSRGSVGSSFVAFLTGITEVNALPAHYLCPKCKRVEFDVPEQYTCGMDLPARDCPVCGTRMNKDGYNIPFEVFLGFNGDKVPDIDLNFSGEYQNTGQHYIETMFGEGNVFRAGTIGTIAEKTAFGYVLKYLEKKNAIATQCEKERLALGITGVKRSTGQHPGGMVLCPAGYDIYDFVAIQHPADDLQSEFITTHYDFNSMHDVLVKVDMLGHDDPTMLKDLQDLTGIPPREVPLDDPEIFKQVMQLFLGPECMGLTSEQTLVETGTLGVPELGTVFVRQMLVDTKPTSMEELIRISGLSHGTDVWTGNAQDLVKNGTVPLNQCLCTRDDIMNQLIGYGVDFKTAFDTMEFVRKGKAAKGDGLKSNMLKAMQDNNVPQWFIDSCNKIQYMFPKAHAVAYVTYALRIAYFKLFYPAEYYTSWLKRNKEDFSGTDMIVSCDVLRSRIDDLTSLEHSEREKKEGKINMLLMLLEMQLRGVQVRPVDIYKSDPGRFLLQPDKSILPPLSSLDNLGLSAATVYADIRAGGTFLSREEMRRRGVQPSIIEAFSNAGILGDIPNSTQMSLF